MTADRLPEIVHRGIPPTLIHDRTLSWTARGVYMCLAAEPCGLTAAGLVAMSPDTEDTIRAALRELDAAGWADPTPDGRWIAVTDPDGDW